ncbi:E3 ubiquitin-protein ligase TRIM69 isoform X3 [Embiotoca jacksoni]|uniref:E3 ubiquitin-protein ligase TRIM69 isoform X3 n=1 Tax=Embiotoca jacksoni TaxID=100190 RepID=UPI003704C0F2
MSKNQKEVKKIQSVYLQNLEKLNQGIKPDKKSWKPKEGDFAVQTAMDKLRQPPTAGQVAKSSANRISRDLTCSICLDLFKQPVSLPCDHTFCRGCIEGYWTGPRSPGQGGTGSCPQCRKVYPGQCYRPNRIVANIVESYCHGLEESGTEACLADVGMTERAPVPRCNRHREELKLYCDEDQELVCLVCGLSQEHRNHTMVCVQEAEKKYRASLNSSMDSLKAELNTALQYDREAEDEVKKLKEHTADLKQRIEAQFSDLHQFLYQEEKLLQVKLKTEERRELIRLDEHKALLCVEISRLQRAVHEIEAKLQEQDPFTLLRSIKVLLQSFTFVGRPSLKFEKPVFTPPSLCEGRFAGPLQYRVWKSMRGSLYPGSTLPCHCSAARASPTGATTGRLKSTAAQSGPSGWPGSRCPERESSKPSLLMASGLSPSLMGSSTWLGPHLPPSCPWRSHWPGLACTWTTREAWCPFTMQRA